MKLTVKSPKDRHEVEISDTASVQELRVAVAEKFATALDKVCLIFGGKILKDEEKLSQHAIKDGLTVHLVVRTGNKVEQSGTSSSSGATAMQSSAAAAPSGADPMQTGPGGAGSVNPFAMFGDMGFGGMGGGMGGGMAEMQQRMMSNLMSNPEQLRALMDSPFMRELTSNPDVFRSVLQNNPQFRELTERNPELGHLLNNPDVLRQSLELARNPAMLNEMMRNYDRTLANVENLPGGFAALQRMYRDVQDPLMNAAQEAFGAPNPYAASPSRAATNAPASGANNGQQGAENLAPLPNPWSSRPGASRPSVPSASAPLGLGGLWQQMATNPDFVRSAMQSPLSQSMMQSLMSDPAAFESMLNMNPLLANQPQLADELRSQMRTIMASPALQRMMTNPRALGALAQIQSGIMSLQREDPELANLLGFGLSFPGGPQLLPITASATEPQTVPGQAQAPAPSTQTSSESERPAAPEQPTPAQQPTAAAGTQNDAFNSMMNQVLQMLINQRAGGSASGSSQAPNSQAANPNASLSQIASLLSALGDVGGAGQAPALAATPNVPPEQRFATQLAQLEAMGFYDRQENLQALIATRGNVDAAIDRILQSPPQ